MSPVTNHVVGQLRQLVYYHLDCNLVRNALFMAGRLQACEPKSPEAAYLLALCQLKLGEHKAAYGSCKIAGPRGAHLGCSYVFAQACLALGRYTEGSSALERSKGLWAAKNSWSRSLESACESEGCKANAGTFQISIQIPGDNIFQTPLQYTVYKENYGMVTGM